MNIVLVKKTRMDIRLVRNVKNKSGKKFAARKKSKEKNVYNYIMYIMLYIIT